MNVIQIFLQESERCLQVLLKVIIYFEVILNITIRTSRDT